MQSRNFGAAIKSALQATSILLLAVFAVLPSAEAATSRLPRTASARMAYAPSVGSRNGLPATTMDSFVANAVQAGKGDEIYGDEGQDGAPPFFGFTANHRINAGIVGQQDAGLSTGHGSRLPDAWGRDEFLGGQEWSQGGYNGGAYAAINTSNVQTVASNVMPPVAPSFQNSNPNGYDLGATTGGDVNSGSGTYGFGNVPTTPVSQTNSQFIYGGGLNAQSASPESQPADAGF